jgi:hypothetical protein
MNNTPFPNNALCNSLDPYLQPNTEEGFKITYTDFSDLVPYESNTKFLELMRMISDFILEPTQTWPNIFYSINELRRVLKFHQDLFENFFHNLVGQIAELITLSQTEVVKLIFRLISEIVNQIDLIDSIWLRKLIPKILVKTTSEIHHIKSEAFQLLTHIVDNVFRPEVIEILLENVGSKHAYISNNSFEFLMKQLNYYDEACIDIAYDNFEWYDILNYVLDLYEYKKEPFVKKAFRIMDVFIKSFEKNYNYPYLERILQQIEDLEFHSKFDKMMKEKEFFDNKGRKRESQEFKGKNRQSIKVAKRMSTGENFWKDDNVYLKTQRNVQNKENVHINGIYYNY